ncbi:KR domain-containing protein [Streptomyces sp. PTY087I2]|uniref:KR domain-containing protein n=1 Tax=Streptomyces sp. PTY087I2 TaxID=1819298 RepID=UPI00080B7757|nr:KR domain-containing protein [Streptomyces sp. PTY087I2]OCC10600.1 Polyketide synthase PksJ [Streptomyces sp. PTY087I2]
MSPSRQGATTLLGAEGARELIAFLARSGPGPATVVIERAPEPGGPAHSLRLRRPAAEEEPAEPRLLDRHVLRLAPAPRREPGPPTPFFPPSTALLTYDLAALGACELPMDTALLPLSQQDALEEAVRRAAPRHVRIVVDLTREDKLQGPSERLLRLHDALFRTAKACAGLPALPESFVLVILGGIDADRVQHPSAGLFSGFAKSLALEWPDSSVVAVVHEAAALTDAEADASAESLAPQLLPVVAFAGGVRLLLRATRDPGAAAASPEPLRTVVAAGGGRGIGATLLTALARRDRPRFHIIGSTPLGTGEPEEAIGRQEFIRTHSTGPDRLTVREANAAYDRLAAAAEVRTTVRTLEEICGADRVTYHACDLRDPDAVREAVARIESVERDGVDLLLNVAGTNRAASVAKKSLADFRAVRDLKVRTHTNLKAAFGDRQPRRWCNFGSFVGFTGQNGETDYGSANDYLNTAAAYSAARGTGEFTIGWTLWRDVGLGATPIMRRFLAKSAQFTAMPTPEGIGHFLHEIDQAEPAPLTVLFGDAERATMERAAPGYLDFCRAPAPDPAPASGRAASSPAPVRPAPPDFFVDDIVDRGAGRLTVVRTFSLERDAYLREHVVNGYPTLPGTFVPELAAQAAMHLVPGRVPAVLEDIRLDAFLRVYRPGRGETKKITARLVESGRHESVVDVEVTGDVLAPGGRLLVKDRRHFSARVRLRDEPVTAPRWEHWDDQGAEPVADPYHLPNPAVLLSGVFVSTGDTRAHPHGRRARYVPDRPGIERWFSGLVVPSVLLDGLARTSVLNRSDGDWIPLAVPRTIRRIDLYDGHTDASLAAAGTRVELYSLPARLDLESAEENRSVAVTAAGDVVLQIKDMTGAVLGHVNQTTGEYRGRRNPAEETTP